MAFEFVFPDVGEGITEGTIVKWLVKEGDAISADQTIVQVETDKAVADIPSPRAGTLLKINYTEGQTIKVGEVLCSIGAAGESAPSADGGAGSKKATSASKERTQEPAVKEVTENATEAKQQTTTSNKQKEETIEVNEESSVRKGVNQSTKVLAAPAVRKAARDANIDLMNVKGSGANGAILMKDLKGNSGAAAQTKPAGIVQQKATVKRKYDQYGYLERVPLKGIRKTIAANMIKSLHNSAQLSTFDDIDVTKLWSVRKREKGKMEKKGIKLTFLPFVIRALIASLKEHPALNSRIEGDDIVYLKYFNIGIAVETEVGLMVPVIKIAEDKSIEKLAKEIADLGERAKSRKLDVMDMSGSTFTITNYGSIGGTYATPVLNHQMLQSSDLGEYLIVQFYMARQSRMLKYYLFL